MAGYGTTLSSPCDYLLDAKRWVGPTHFSPGVWVGVELDTRDGRNDGEVQGSRYFTCAAGHGVFVRMDSVSLLKGDAPPAGGVPSYSPSTRDRRRPNVGPGDITPVRGRGAGSRGVPLLVCCLPW